MADNNMYLVVDVWNDTSKEVFSLNTQYTLDQLKEKYADFLIAGGQRESGQAAIEIDDKDIIKKIIYDCQVDIITVNQFLENTDNMKREVFLISKFLDENRSKDKNWFISHYGKLNNIFAAEGNTIDFCPDICGNLLSSLTFSDDGKTLLEVGTLSIDDLFEENCISDYGESYHHETIKTIFNYEINKFNLLQKSGIALQKELNCDLGTCCKLLAVLHDYMSDPYGCGEDLEYSELVDFIKKQNGVFIDLAYTTLGDHDQHEVSVAYDLKQNCFKHYVDCVDVSALVEGSGLNSINEFVETISNCSFDDIIRDCYDVLDYVYGDN